MQFFKPITIVLPLFILNQIMLILASIYYYFYIEDRHKHGYFYMEYNFLVGQIIFNIVMCSLLFILIIGFIFILPKFQNLFKFLLLIEAVYNITTSILILFFRTMENNVDQLSDAIMSISISITFFRSIFFCININKYFNDMNNLHIIYETIN